MIVQSIRVCYWRSILRDLHIGPFLEGLNVVHAPNGSGKSSLFEALRRGLMDRHNVKGEDINQIQPWGKNLAPKVIVEFKHNGDSYRITKQFIQAPMSLIEKKRNDMYEPDANGREADEQLQKLLTKNPPSKGLSRAEHWGWAQALWAPQGSLALGSLSSDVLSDIRGVLSAHLAAGGSSKVEKEIDRLYEQFFTGKGKLKKGKDAPESFRLQEKLIVARNELGLAQERYASFQRTSDEVEKFRAESCKAEQELGRIKTLLDSTESEVKQYLELKAEKTKSESETKVEESRFRELNSVIEQITKAESDLTKERNDLEPLKKVVETDRKEFQTAEEQFNSCQEDANKIKTLETEVNGMVIGADSARSFADITSKLSDIREKLSNISTVTERLTALKSQKEAIKAPNDETLKAISKAIRDRDDANLMIEASLMNVEVVTETELTLDVIKGDDVGSFRSMSGETVVFKGTPEVSVRIPDVATIRAWGPTGSIEELRQKSCETEQTISKLTDPYGTADMARLEELSGQAKEIAKQIRDAEFQIGMLLGKEKQEELDLKKSELEQGREGILKRYPDWTANQPDWENLKLEADKAATSHGKQKDEASEKLEAARKRLNDLKTNIQVAETKIQAAEKTIHEIEDRLINHKKDNKTPVQRNDELNQISLSWKAARINLENVENRLKEYQDDPEKVADKLRSEKDSLDNQLRDCKEKENVAIGSLKNLSESGSYTVLAEVNERIAQLERDIQREELQQKAISLLHDTIGEVRKEALSSVSKPVEDAATETLNFICGADLGRICLGDSFEPSQIKPESYDSNVELINLSGGEREQLYFSVRLALADVLAQQERQLVVLDDVLTATDSARLARVLNVLEDRAKRLQIIVLTCHPERYQPLGSAKFFDFTAA